MNTQKLPDSLTAVLDEHIAIIKELITTRTIHLAQTIQPEEQENTSRPIVLLRHLTQAINEFAPAEMLELKEKRFWTRFWEAITPFTVVCLIMTIVFAAFGAFYGTSSADVRSFIDISKIFAGVIVGSTSAAFIGKNTFRIKKNPANISKTSRRRNP